MFPRFLPALLCGLLLSFPIAAATPAVVTTIKPLQLIAAAVLEDIADPEVLLPPSASPHNYALRPSDRRLLSAADRVYWVGPDLERFLQRLLEDHSNARRVDQAAGVTLRYFTENHAHNDHGHGSHEHHEHAPGTLDAHIWLSVANARHIARWMADDLGQLYPEHQPRLQENTEAFVQRLEQLDARLQQRLRPLAGKPYFVFHDAYGYLEEHLGLQPQGIFTLSAEIQPGARHLQGLRNKLVEAGPSCVFREPQFPADRVRTLSEGLPVHIAELDPLGIEAPVGPRGYEQLLATLGDELAGCLERL